MTSTVDSPASGLSPSESEQQDPCRAGSEEGRRAGSSCQFLTLQLFPERPGITQLIAYRPDVDGLRAVAALSVVLVHAGWLPGGAYGVDIFFVISGFLISRIILQSLSMGKFSFIDFYARRIKRIFPALIVLLVVIGPIGWLLLPTEPYRMLGNDIVAGAAFVQNLWMYFGPNRPTNQSDMLLAHLWTLGIEEQFYLMWPLFLWFASRTKSGVPLAIAVAIAVSFLSFIWLLLTNHDDPSWNDNAAWLLPWHRLWEFAMGGLLACIQLRRMRCAHSELVSNRPQFWLAAQPHLGALGAAAILVCFLASGLQPWSQVCMAALGALLLIAAGPHCWINRRLLAARPLVFVGLISYPLYLWHQPILTFCDILFVRMSLSDISQSRAFIKIGAILMSVVLSYVTFQYLESPIRLSKRVRRTACILCAALACCGGAGHLASLRF